MKYDKMLIYKGYDTTFWYIKYYGTKIKIHKNTTRMGLEKPWDDPLVILEVVSIKRLQVLSIHGQA